MNQIDRKLALYQLAESQAGFFTAKQAEELGFDSKNFHHFLKTTEWTRLARGLYRISVLPPLRRQDFWEMYFWSRNKADKPQGVFSHESALDLFDLTDELPSKIHMTVPGDFRRNAAIPEILRLYKEDLKDQDIELVDGLPCTTAAKTILDLCKRGAPESLINQAIDDATKKGLLTRKDREELARSKSANG
jgi:predicted transcriptional regulator of viral defense system